MSRLQMLDKVIVARPQSKKAKTQFFLQANNLLDSNQLPLYRDEPPPPNRPYQHQLETSHASANYSTANDRAEFQTKEDDNDDDELALHKTGIKRKALSPSPSMRSSSMYALASQLYRSQPTPLPHPRSVDRSSNSKNLSLSSKTQQLLQRQEVQKSTSSRRQDSVTNHPTSQFSTSSGLNTQRMMSSKASAVVGAGGVAAGAATVPGSDVSAQSLALQAQDAYNATVNMQHQWIAQHNHQQQLIRQQQYQNEEQLSLPGLSYEQQQALMMHQNQLAHDSVGLQNQFYQQMYQLQELLQQRQQVLFYYLQLAGIDPNSLFQSTDDRAFPG
jgi:hypothetical protein